MELTANFLTAFVITPIAGWSLLHQWYHTSAGATGHPTSDAHERLMDPDIDCPRERVKVTILNAHSLRKADVLSKSDPYAVCLVPSKPYSFFKTSIKQDTLEPVWDEGGELSEYRLHDALSFTVYDFDEPSLLCCCKGDDLLGHYNMGSAQFHPNGFEGELVLDHAGKTQATLRVRVELLGATASELVRADEYGRSSPGDVPVGPVAACDAGDGTVDADDGTERTVRVHNCGAGESVVDV